MGMLSFWWYLYFPDWAEVSSHGHQCHRWVLSWRPLSFGVHSPLCHEVPPPNYKDLPGAPAPLGGRDAFRCLSPALWVGKSHLAAPLLPSWPWTSVGVLYHFRLHWMVRFMFPLLPDPRIVPGVSSLSPAHIHRPPHPTSPTLSTSPPPPPGSATSSLHFGLFFLLPKPLPPSEQNHSPDPARHLQLCPQWGKFSFTSSRL